MVIDECNDTYCFKAFCVPEAETLTRDEVEAFKAVLLSRVEDNIPAENYGWYWIEDLEIFFRLDWYAGMDMPEFNGEYWFGKRNKRETE